MSLSEKYNIKKPENSNLHGNNLQTMSFDASDQLTYSGSLSAAQINAVQSLIKARDKVVLNKIDCHGLDFPLKFEGFAFNQEQLDKAMILAPSRLISFKKAKLDNLEIKPIRIRRPSLGLAANVFHVLQDVSFEGASMKGSNISAIFQNCSFKNATLWRSDLANSTFENCNFDGANLKQTHKENWQFAGNLNLQSAAFDNPKSVLNAKKPEDGIIVKIGEYLYNFFLKTPFGPSEYDNIYQVQPSERLEKQGARLKDESKSPYRAKFVQNLSKKRQSAKDLPTPEKGG